MKKLILHISPLIVFLSLIFISSTNAQKNGSIYGVCTDASTQETLIGANVVIKGTTIGSSSDIDGSYKISSLEGGNYVVEVSYLGYNLLEKEVNLESGQKLELNLQMTATSYTGEVVTVTAQAQGQIAAINQQLSSKTIANIISSKSIQEIPSANAAEAVGKLPGISIQRNGGEGNKVVVRGLDPKYSRVLIEGSKMAATGSNDRSSDLSMISPYMLDGIEVSKAAMPDKEGDVIGGYINFILRDAPKEPNFDVLLQTGYNSLKNKFGDYKLVLGGSKRFANDKIGIFAQIDVENRNRSSYELNVGYFNSTAPELQEDVDVSISNLLLKDINRGIDRFGGVVVMDYKLPNGSIKFSNFASSIKKEETIRQENLRPFYLDHYYTLENNENSLLVMNNALRWKNKFGGFNLNMGLSYAYSQNKLPLGFSFNGQEKQAFADGMNQEDAPSIVAGFANNNVSEAKVYNIVRNSYDTHESEIAYDLNLDYTFNINDNLSLMWKSGIKFKKLNKFYDKEVREIPIHWGGEINDAIGMIIDAYPDKLAGVDKNDSKLPYQLFVDPNYKPENFLGGDYTISNIPDLEFVKGVNDLLGEVAENYIHHPGSIKDDYTGNEYYKAAYTMVEMKIGKSITFTPGVRVEGNKTTYSGVRGNSDALRWIEGYIHSDTTTTRQNTFILPMFHLKYQPLKWFDLRLAYTKTLARPSYNQIIPYWDRGLEIVDWNDANLKVAQSQNLDAYASFHSSKLGLVTVGGFYKKIKDLVYPAGVSSIIDATAYGLPSNDSGKKIYRVINNPYPVNLYGLEAEWQTRFFYLGGFWKGITLNLNYTHTFSEVKYPQTIIESNFSPEPPYVTFNNIDTFYVDRLILQPNDIFNTTIGYDFKKASIRFSMLYQNDIFAVTNFWERHRATSDSYLRFDLSMKYKFKIKEMDGFEMLLNIGNLSGAIERDFNTGTGFPVKEQHYGSTIDLGFRYRM